MTYRTPTSGRSSPIRRSWPRTRGAVSAAACFAGCAALLELFVVRSAAGHAGAAVLLALGALFVWVAVGAGAADCPLCGGLLSVISGQRDPAILCPGCRAFLESDGRTVRETPEDTLATFPVFGAVLRGTPAFPDRCCVCGEASTRRLSVRAAGAGPTYEVPHCDAHERGASLRKDGERAILRFRSLRYLQSFLAQNELEPHGSNTRLARDAGKGSGATAATRKEGRWFSFAAALVLWGLAAFGHAFISNDGLIELGGVGGTNLVVLVLYGLLGKTLVTALEIGMGLLFFAAFLTSFRGAPRANEPAPSDRR